MHVPEIRLIVPDTPALIEATRDIFREYASSLAVDLSFQGFEPELRSLPGEYAGPNGCLLLALVDGAVAGCGAYRRITDVDYPNACEMKRLYVRRAYRRFGLGRQVAQALIDDARQARYSSMLLDTLDDMEAARELYASLGFVEVPPFYFNPLPGAHYLCVDLDSLHSRY
jgi:ribosomal protein S18 acetylase RimI-like enzyme